MESFAQPVVTEPAPPPQRSALWLLSGVTVLVLLLLFLWGGGFLSGQSNPKSAKRQPSPSRQTTVTPAVTAASVAKPEPVNPVTSNHESGKILEVNTADFELVVERQVASRPGPATNAANTSRPTEYSASPAATPAASGPVGDGQEVVHIVARGDTLWDITQRHLGNPFRYPELAKLSQIRNPDLIYPGDRIRIRKKTPKR